MDVGPNYQSALDEDIIADLRNYFPPDTPEKDIVGKIHTHYTYWKNTAHF